MAYDKTTVWDGGGGDNNWSTADNWDNGVPGSDSLAQFDATSTKDCTIDGSKPCGALDVQAGYSGGTISLGANTFTVSGDSGSALAHVTIAANADMFDAGTGTVDITGTGNISNPGTTNAFYNLTQTGTVTTTVTDDVYIDNVFTTSNTGTVTDDGGGTRDVHINGSLVVGGVTWVSVSTLALWFGIGTTIPGDDYGNINIRVRLANTGTVTMGGNVTTTNGIVVASTVGNTTSTLDTGGFNLSCADLHLGVSGQILRGGELALTGVSTLTVTTELHVLADDGVQINGITVAASGTNAISIGGSWTIAGTMDMQDSIVTFDGSGTQEVTSGGESFADVVVNCSGTVELQDDLICADLILTAGTFNTDDGDSDWDITCASFDMNSGTFNPNTSTISVGGNCTLDGGTVNMGASIFQLTGSGDLTNSTVGNRFNQLTQNAGIVTTLIGLVYVDNLTCGVGSTIRTDGGDHDLRIQLSLVVNTVTWSSNGGDLKIWFEKDGSVTFPGDDYGDASIHFRRNGATLTFGGDVITTGLVRAFTKSANQTGTMSSGGYDLTCGELQMGYSGVPNYGANIIFTGAGKLICNGDCVIYADNGVQINRLAWDAGNTETSIVTGSLSIEANAELDWVSSCDHILKVGGDFTLAATASVEQDIGTIEFNGSVAQTVVCNGQTLANVTVTNSHVDGVTFADAMDLQGILTFNSTASAIRVDFDETGAHVWTSVAQTGGNAVVLRSEVDTNAWDVTLANPATLLQIDVKDSNLSGSDIDVTDPSNTDSGNNSANWLFPTAVGGGVDRVAPAGVERGVLIGTI